MKRPLSNPTGWRRGTLGSSGPRGAPEASPGPSRARPRFSSRLARPLYAASTGAPDAETRGNAAGFDEWRSAFSALNGEDRVAVTGEPADADASTRAARYTRARPHAGKPKGRGCNEGDLGGACTVMVTGRGRAARATQRLPSLFLTPASNGKAVRTVEGIAGPAAALAPGAGCDGRETRVANAVFCTPGFVVCDGHGRISTGGATSTTRWRAISAAATGYRADRVGPAEAAAEAPVPDWMPATRRPRWSQVVFPKEGAFLPETGRCAGGLVRDQPGGNR